MKHILESTIKPADEATIPFRFVLHRMDGKLCTHMETLKRDDFGLNLMHDGYHHGHYGGDEAGMLMDFANRCIADGLQPILPNT